MVLLVCSDKKSHTRKRRFGNLAEDLLFDLSSELKLRCVSLLLTKIKLSICLGRVNTSVNKIWYLWPVLALTAPWYTPWLLCVCLHYLMKGDWKPHFHTYWSHPAHFHTILPYQIRFSSHKWRSHVHCYQETQFLLWKRLLWYTLHWILPGYNCAVRKPVNQLASSTRYDPMRWRGIARQLSVSVESWLACWWQWNWSVGLSSFRGRSWRRVCSSRSVT